MLGLVHVLIMVMKSMILHELAVSNLKWDAVRVRSHRAEVSIPDPGGLITVAFSLPPRTVNSSRFWPSTAVR